MVMPTASAANPVSETYVWPASGQMTINGHGYGHGRGMSQWGAYGAATKGLSHQQILAHYYPGTALQTAAGGTIRVWGEGAGNSAVTVAAEPGLTVQFGTGAPQTLPAQLASAAVTQWRVTRNGSTSVLHGLAGGIWRPHAAAWSGAATFTGPSGTAREVRGATQIEHRGQIQAVPADTGLQTIIALPLESYLRAVVPAEMPASWPAAAVRAQAIAARTYASYERATAPANRGFDVYESTRSQVYRGAASYLAGQRTGYEHALTDAAITATAGQIVTFNGAAAFTQFGSSNGGWTVAGTQPYLRSFADPYDGVIPNSGHTWSARIDRAVIQRAYPALGTLTALRVVSRDGNGQWGGRIANVELIGTAGSQLITGARLREVVGLAAMKSTWWQPYVNAGQPSARDYDGDNLPDLLATKADGTLWRYSGNGMGGILAAEQIGHGWAGVHLVPVGDLNGDGHPDAVAWTDDGLLWLYPGNGRGWFGARTQIGHGWRSVRTITGVGDLDGDGHDDLVASFTDGRLWLFPGTGRGWFQPKRPIGHGWGDIDALLGPGDFDGDGNVDVIGRTTTGRIWLYRGNGRGWFHQTDPIGTGWSGMSHMLSPGDWTGDGWPDVLAVYPDGVMRVFPGNGRGWFGPAAVIGTGWTGFIDVV